MRRKVITALMSIPIVAVISASCSPSEISRVPHKPDQLIGYMSYWDQPRGMASLQATKNTLTQVSPSWYAPGPDGSLVPQEDGAVDDRPATINRIKAFNLSLVPAIANYRDKSWTRAAIGPVLADAKRRTGHVRRIRDLVLAKGYDGIDIDYENLDAADRDHFTAFIGELAEALHADGRSLSVTLHPKTSEPGPSPKNVAQDYAALGRVADEVRVMVYDYHSDGSPPGPLAPMEWAREVMVWAATQVPAEKLVMGLGTYGYDWQGTHAVSLTWTEVMALQRRVKAKVRYDAEQESSWFEYVDPKKRRRTVWFEDARSIAAKRRLATELGLRGVHYWRLGGEDPQIWVADPFG